MSLHNIQIVKYETNKNETDFEQNYYWPTYFNAVRSEEQWTEIELNEINYAEEAADFIIETETEMEAEILIAVGSCKTYVLD